ncbi:MAG: type I glutamate--ammonia ligase [Gammaproteobacteria bacterium]
MPINHVLKMLDENQVSIVDLRFTDTRGKEQHVSVTRDVVNEEFFSTGKMMDGSSISGWKEIHNSDMLILPDPTTAVMDPFCEEPTLNLRCDVIEPSTMEGYERCPRSLAKRAEAYLSATGIADACYVGPEPEFFIFDSVRWTISMNQVSFDLESTEGAWSSNIPYDQGNRGHRPVIKGGYFPVPPVDSSQDIRTAMSLVLHQMGVEVEAHHHEVATGNQNEISTKFNSLLRKADEMQIFKYVVHNVAHAHGKTATFMPKPLVGDNGSGMHCHLSLAKNGENLFIGNGYAGLSDLALYYSGGIIKHARALNAFTNPGTNSYRRLVPGFEAPVLLAYSSRNRSAAIRIPYVTSPKATRIEVRFPDPIANPYLAFSAMLMAGLDGIRNKIHPGEATEKDLYEATYEELKDIPTVCASLEQAIDSIDKDRDFLKEGNVFSDDLIDAYIGLKSKEITRLRMATHPLEFEMYYSE